jgi:hemoglobin
MRAYAMSAGLLLALVMSVVMGACAPNGAPSKDAGPPAETLYVRLGGHDGIEKISSAWIDKVVADKRLAARFTNTDVPRFKARMAGFIAQTAGGPDVYTGKDMKTEHRTMAISNDEWTAFMDDLQAALTDLQIPAVAREELLVKLMPMKTDIVGQ